MNTQETESSAEFLASVDLLSALTRAEIERLADNAQLRQFPRIAFRGRQGRRG